MPERVIITVCGRAGSKGFRNKNLKTFCSKPLVHYSISAALLFLKKHPGIEADLVLNTDSGLLRDMVSGLYPEVYCLHRPAALAGDAVAKLEVFRHSLAAMEEKRGLRYDYLLDLDITSPLRREEDITGCFNTLCQREDLDLVMSAVKSRRNPYMNMGRRVGAYVEPVIRSEVTARQQAPVCYDINASVYAFRRRFLAPGGGIIWDAKCEVYEMEDTAVLDIDSEEDFVWMELIARHLYATREEFARVRDAIR